MTRHGQPNELPLVQALTWRRSTTGWRLYSGKRCFGEVIEDAKYPGMWRAPLSGGRFSDMANLSWARNAVYEAAVREITWEHQVAQQTGDAA